MTYQLLDITDKLRDKNRSDLRESNTKLYSISFSDLLSNTKILKDRYYGDLFLLMGIFDYYSPSGIEYDFENRPTTITLSSGASTIKHNGQRLDFIIFGELIRNKPELALKSLRFENSSEIIAPTRIKNPIFGFNQEIQSSILLPFYLAGIEDIASYKEYEVPLVYP